jgi:hypothetical protein
VNANVNANGNEHVNANVNEPTIPNIDAKPRPPSAHALPHGLLTLNARPWAHVTIDGEKRPDTPIQKLTLPAGPHKVRLVCPPTGHELRFTVVVEADREVMRIADLTGDPHLVDSD